MILGSVYFQYFSKEKTIIEETAKTNLESEKLYQGLEKKIIELEKKNDKLKEEIEIKIDKLDKVFPEGTRRGIVSQEITPDFVLEVFDKAKRARNKKKKEDLLAVAEMLSKNIGKWLVE